MRGRAAWWVVLALLAAGCASPGSPAATTAPATTDQTDVWFMQHMVPHLYQQTSIVSLTRAHITHPQLLRLADTIAERDRADSSQLQGWLAVQGLSPHGHSHQRVDNRRQTDLERLARLRGVGFDLALLDVMMARDRAAIRICRTEARQGTRPEVRQLAQRMLASQQQQVRQLRAWRRAWSTVTSKQPTLKRPSS